MENAVLDLLLTAHYVGTPAFERMNADMRGLVASSSALGAAGAGLKAVGDAAMLLGVAWAAGVGAAVKVAAEYDQALARITATLPDHRDFMLQSADAVDAHTAALTRNKTAIQALKAEIADASVAYGVDPQAIAGGSYYLFSSLGALGMNNPAGISKFLNTGVISQLAAYVRASGDPKNGGVSFESAAQDLPRIFTSYGLNPSQWGGSMGMLTYLEQNAHMTQAQLVQGLNKFTPAATALGIPFSQSALLIAALASSGVAGSRAGTESSSGLVSLMGGKHGQAELAALGLSDKNFFDKNGAPLPLDVSLGLLGSKLAGLSPTDRLAAEHELFGLVGFRAYGGLLNTGMGKYDALTKDAKAAGILSSDKQSVQYMNMIALANMQGPVAQFQSLAAAVKLFGIAVGEAAMPYVLRLVAVLRNLLVYMTGLANAFKDGGINGFLSMLGQAHPLLAGILGFVLRIGDALKNLGQHLGVSGGSAFGALMAFGPLALMGGGLGLSKLGGGLGFLDKILQSRGEARALAEAGKLAEKEQYAKDLDKWVREVGGINRTLEGPATKRDQAVRFANDLFKVQTAPYRDAAGNLVVGAKGGIPPQLLRQFSTQLNQRIKNADRNMGTDTAAFLGKRDAAGRLLSEPLKPLAPKAEVGMLEGLFKFGQTSFGSTKGFGGLLKGLGDGLANLKGPLGAVKGLFTDFPGTIAKLATSFGGLLQGGLEALPGLLGGIATVGLPVIAIVLAIAGAVAIGVLAFTKFRTQTLQAIQPLMAEIGNVFNFIKTIIGQAIAQITTTWNQMWPQIKPAMEQFLTAVKGMGPVWQVLGTVIKIVIGTIVIVITALVQAFLKVLPSIIGVFTFIIKFITDVAKLVVAIFTGKWGEIPGILKNIFGDILGFLGNALGAILGFIGGFVGQVFQNFSDMGHQVVVYFRHMIEGVLDLMSKIPGPWQDMAKTVLQGLKDLDKQEQAQEDAKNAALLGKERLAAQQQAQATLDASKAKQATLQKQYEDAVDLANRETDGVKKAADQKKAAVLLAQLQESQQATAAAQSEVDKIIGALNGSKDRAAAAAAGLTQMFTNGIWGAIPAAVAAARAMGNAASSAFAAADIGVSQGHAGTSRTGGYATGGLIPGYATGGSVSSHLVKVGEAGWEYALLPGGTRVFNHQDSLGMLRDAQLALRGGTGGGPLKVARLHVDTLHLPDRFWDQLAEHAGGGRGSQQGAPSSYGYTRSIQESRERATGGYERFNTFDQQSRDGWQQTR